MLGWLECDCDERKRRVVMCERTIRIRNGPRMDHRDLILRRLAAAIGAIFETVREHLPFARHISAEHVRMPHRGCTAERCGGRDAGADSLRICDADRDELPVDR